MRHEIPGSAQGRRNMAGTKQLLECLKILIVVAILAHIQGCPSTLSSRYRGDRRLQSANRLQASSPTHLAVTHGNT
jgi:hypothetical protein